MSTIALGRTGLVAIVDDEDFGWLSRESWHLTRGPYAKRNGPRGSIRLMHRVILNAPHGQEVDHINGNSLDNRRSNLRLATRRQNCFNQHVKKSPHAATCFRGVVRVPSVIRPWRAIIGHEGRRLHLGVFATAEEAARAYDAAALRLFGEFASPNFPPHEEAR